MGASTAFQVELRSEDRFFVLACDGVWDVMSNQEVVQFVSVCLDSGMSLDNIASQLLDACLAPDPRETRGIGGDSAYPNVGSVLLVLLHFQHQAEATGGDQ